ncbi:MAG: hypothetical protein V7K40_07740 [Nostoc sp.]|uniref:DUF7004 family protein n=1 Tax=Nostoc sp. TaxID=1180 RepID=UPI002FFB2D6C
MVQQIDRQTEDLSSFKSPKSPDTKMSSAHLSNEPRLKLKLFVEEVFFHAYAACLIAEERKSDRYAETTNYPRIGKRIKLLAAYQFLFEGLSVESAANFLKGKKAWQIDRECKNRGI